MENKEKIIDDNKRKTNWIRNIYGSNFIKRFVLGSVMLPSFVFLCKNDEIFISIFIVLLVASINYEIISIAKKPNRPFSFSKYIVLFFSAIILIFKLHPAFILAYPSIIPYTFFLKRAEFFFSLYTLNLIIFILGLRKGKLVSQLLLFTIVHVSSFVLGTTGSVAIQNTMKGKFYFFYPAILVISNDIFAYVIGKLFGRTPLYSLSPKKTWEGFIGASLFTFLTGLFLSYLKINHNFLPDSLDIQLKKYVSQDFVFLNIPVIYLHNVAFSFGASFIAPFLGFLASAIKRAFKRKDFGDLIPGHGGVTDRMDCQIMMAFFTYFYIRVFLKEQPNDIPNICEHIIDSYTHDEIEMIIQKLKEN